MNIWPELFRVTSFPDNMVREAFHQFDLEPFREDLEVVHCLNSFVANVDVPGEDGKRWALTSNGFFTV